MRHRNCFALAVSKRRKASEVGRTVTNAVKLENTSIFGEFPVHMRKTHLRDQMADVSNASRNALARTFAVRSRVSRQGKQEREEEILLRECAVIIRHSTFDCSCSQIGFHFGSKETADNET